MNQKRSKLNQLTALYNIPSIDLETEGISQEEIQTLVDTFISVQMCNLHKILPLKLLPQNPPCLIIGMVNPHNLQAENDILRIARSKRIQWQKVIILEEDFNKFCPKKQSSKINDSTATNAHPQPRIALTPDDNFNPFEASLIQSGYISKEQLKTALIEVRKTKKSLLKVLEEITQRSLSPEWVKRYKQHRLSELKIAYGVDTFDLDTEEFNISKITELIDSLLPIQLCRRHQLIPLQLLDSEPTLLVIVMVNPDDLQALDDANKILRSKSLKLQTMGITEEDFDKLLTKYYEEEKRQQQIKQAKRQEKELYKLDDISNFIDYVNEEEYSQEDLAYINTDNQPPIIKLVNNIFVKAITEKVEEIYIQSQQNSLSIQFRKNGQKKEYFKLPKDIIVAVVNRIKLIANLNPTIKLSNQKIKIIQIYKQKKYEFILNIIKGDYGENVYLQNLKNPDISFNLEDLIINKSVVNNLRNLIKLPHGLIIITGGNKVRKTVVSYGLLNELAKDSYNIYSIEDITSYNLSGITQISILEQKNQSHYSIFKEILAQNPDIIYVNKLTDGNTAKQVFSAVSQGKLVLAEMDFYQVEHILFKFLEWGIKPSEIALNLKAIINQRLIRQVCSQCRTSYTPSEQTLSLFKEFNWTNNPPIFYNAKLENYNCTQCRGSGYQDMIIINEILKISSDMQRLMLRDETILDIRQKAIEKGMNSLLFNALNLVDLGLTTLEEVQKVLGDSIELNEYNLKEKIDNNDNLVNNIEELREDENLDDLTDLWT
ncbi:ATPase, T2SS/T4P/T4SS family [Geminocystis sp. CENA526]|uniref:ATPase, T2SS/T4P/T4SS family n=1 Tax=Geminocystis sp. CENA526 TaxID=1355871 RepID=UPI003D6F971D